MKMTRKGLLVAALASLVLGGAVELSSYELSRADMTATCTSATETSVSGGLVQVVCVQPTASPSPSVSTPTPSPSPSAVPTPSNSSGSAIEVKSFISELPNQSANVPSNGFTTGYGTSQYIAINTSKAAITNNGIGIQVGVYVDAKGFVYPGSTKIYAYAVSLSRSPYTGSLLPTPCGPGVPGENQAVTASCPAPTTAPSATPATSAPATASPSPSPSVIPTSTPVAVVYNSSPLPAHIRTYERTQDHGGGCWYGYGGINAQQGCPNPLGTPDSVPTVNPSTGVSPPPTWGDQSVYNSFVRLKAYGLDYVETDHRQTNYIAAAGMSPGAYHDVVRPHNNSGQVAYDGTNTVSSTNTFPDYALAHDNTGKVIYAPGQNYQTGGTFFGNFENGTGAQSGIAWAISNLDGDSGTDPYNNANSCNNATIYPCTFQERFSRSDDSAPTSEIKSYVTFCSGFFNNGNNYGQYQACPSGTVSTSAQWDQLVAYPYSLNPYNPFFTNPLSGLQTLYSSTQTPIVYNNDWDANNADAFAPSVATKVVAGQCENCYGVTQATKDFLNQEDAEIRTQMNGYIWQVFHPDVSSPSDVLTLYAKIALGSLDYNYLMVDEEENTSAVSPVSQTNWNPPFYFTAKNGIAVDIRFTRAAINYNPNSPPASGVGNGIGATYRSTGVYAREFNDCAINQVRTYPCVSIVNNDTSAHAFPTDLLRTYVSSLAYSGVGVVTIAGDTGGLPNTNGPGPSQLATPNVIPAQTGLIFFAGSN